MLEKLHLFSFVGCMACFACVWLTPYAGEFLALQLIFAAIQFAASRVIFGKWFWQ